MMKQLYRLDNVGRGPALVLVFLRANLVNLQEQLLSNVCFACSFRVHHNNKFADNLWKYLSLLISISASGVVAYSRRVICFLFVVGSVLLRYGTEAGNSTSAEEVLQIPASLP